MKDYKLIPGSGAIKLSMSDYEIVRSVLSQRVKHTLKECLDKLLSSWFRTKYTEYTKVL